MAEPNDESQQPQGVATESPQPDEGSIAQSIMKAVMQEQAYQDLNAKLGTLEQELAAEKKEKEEVIASKTELGEFLPRVCFAVSDPSSSHRQCATGRSQ